MSAEPVLERHAPRVGMEVGRYTAVDDLADEWDALASRTGAPPFLRPGWIAAWTRSFGAPGLTILTARRGGELAGVLPLRRRGIGAIGITANSHSPLGGALVDGPDAARALAEALVAERPARVDFSYADPSDGVIEGLRERGPMLARRQSEQPFVDVTGSLDAYVAGLSRSQRKESGRLRRKLEAAGELRFEFADGSDGLDELLEEGFRIEGSGWKSEAGSAIESAPETRRFYTDVAHWAAARGWLRLAFLRLDGRAIAFDYCLEAGGSFYALKGGYDPDYRKLGPGAVLTFESIRRAFDDPGLKTYEFLGTADPYKLAWTSATHERLRAQSFSRWPLGLAHYAAWRYGRPLAKRVMSR